MNKFFFYLFSVCLSFLVFSSCEKVDDRVTTHKLSFRFGEEDSMYKTTRSAASDVFDEFYAKLTTGELVAETYNLTFTNVETGTAYSFSGNWKNAEVELQDATYKVTGKSTATGEQSQEKCSLYFDEMVTVTNQMPEIVLHAYYDCYLFVMTSEDLYQVENCYLFANKYWYAFVNGVFVDILKGSHKDGSTFSVDMSEYSFVKGKYYVYKDISIDEYGVSFLLPTMDDGLVSPVIPNNQIWYTTDNGKVFNPSSSCRFYNSNDETLTYTQTWDGEKWIMSFSDDIAYWTGDWFYVTNSESRLVSFGAPEGLDHIKMDLAGHFYQRSFSGDYVSTIKSFFGQYEGIANNGHLFLVGTDYYKAIGAVSDYKGTITVPKGVKQIGMYAFVACNAKKIVLPSTIESIEPFAFENCNELTDIYCYATKCPTIRENNIWTYVNGPAGTLHYPVGSDYSQFRVPSNWTKVADIE